MRSFVVVFLAVSAVAAEELYCTPGAFFKKDCNTCTCSGDGRSAACTYMSCPPEWNANVNDIDTARDERICEPKSIFSPDNCNICKCNSDGTKAACTFKMCPEIEAKHVNDKYCEPLTTFRPDGCNTCKCSRDGTTAACTLRLCPEAEKPKQVCEPRSIFNDYCNTCSCSDDGTFFACTAMYCDKSIWNKDGSVKVAGHAQTFSKKEQRGVCTPNSMFKDDCNSCICSPDGLTRTCTMMACPKIDEVPSTKVCEPGKVYSPDGCNTCICNKYGTQSACTILKCVPGLKAASEDSEEEQAWGPRYYQGDVCTPGKAFYSECNRCVCMENGKSAFCTLMSCPISH